MNDGRWLAAGAVLGIGVGAEVARQFWGSSGSSVRLGPLLSPNLPGGRYLELSTAHLPQGEMDQVEQGWKTRMAGYKGLDRWVTHAPYDGGAWVSVPSSGFPDADRHAMGKAFPALLKVLEFARAYEVSWVLFDRDASRISDLPTWNW